MNWFLLLLILKLFTNIWTAPIDLLETKDDLQNVSNDFLNKTLNINDQANNLLKSTEDVINSNASHFSENLNESVQNFTENLQNFAAEVEKVLDSNDEKETTKTITEVIPTTEVNGDQAMPIVTSDTLIVSQEETKREDISLTTQNPIESSTEYVEKVLPDSENSKSDNLKPVNAESRSNEDHILSEPVVTENFQNDLNSSTESETIKNVISTSVNNESLKERESVDIAENKTIDNSDNKLELSEDISTTSNAPETEQISQNFEHNFEATTQEFKPEITTISNTQIIKEHFNENVDQIYEVYHKLIESVQLASLDSNPDSTTISYLKESLSPITQKVEDSTLAPLENDNNANKPTAMEDTTINHYPEETSSETPALKETVDSFLNQVADIGSSIEKAGEELKYDASMIYVATENFINPQVTVSMQENMTEIPEPTIEGKDNSEQAPTFKEAVDSFIEEVVEIGSKLGLIPDEKPAKDFPTSTEALSEIINIETTPAYDVKELNESTDSSLNFEQSLDALKGKLNKIADNFEDNTTDSPVILNEENKTEEIAITTPTTMDNLAENENNRTAVVENSETSNFGRSVETLIEAASEIGSNFGNAVFNFLTPSENIRETVTNSPNESLMETTTPVEQNNSDISVTQIPIEISLDETTKSLVKDHENIEVSTAYPTLNNSYSDFTEGITKILEDTLKTTERIPQEGENFTSEVLQQNTGVMKQTEEEQSAKYEEYIPVAVATIPETTSESTKLTDHSKMPLPMMNENETLSEQEPQILQDEKVIIETEQPENTETANKEDYSITTEENQSEKASDNLKEESFNKSEEFTTLSPILQETTTANAAIVFDETTHNLNKFENTLKTLIEQEKLKHEERHALSLETNEQKTTTLAPSTKSPTMQPIDPDTATTTTTQSLEDTTMLPKKFEEELQMAVKALEETTHHHFEEFQNNLKEAFKKFTVWGVEHERPEVTTTTILRTEQNKETTETPTTQQSLAEQPTTIMPEVEVSQEKIEVLESSRTEEPHRSGVINQNFIDKFADNYEESAVATANEMQKEKEESSQLSGLQESMIKAEQTTETPNDLSTMLPVEEEQVELKTNESFVEVTTMYNAVKEDQVPIAENIVEESTGESVETTTEYIAETTPTTPLARVTLQKDLNSVSSILLDKEHNTITPSEDTTAQNPDSEQIKETQTTVSTQTTEATEEIITLPTTELSPKEMVTFIEHTDTTTVKQQQQEQQQEDEESSATTMETTQTQEPLTQASFMEEQQQQLESTTEHDAQTQTAAASGQTATTTTTTVKIEDGDDVVDDDNTSEQETTETDIYSSTVVEEDEMATTTVEPLTTTTAAPVEPEARSLSLPPPKLEYLQNEDGVEVFYGYSIVKHN